jgi:hypothetical protein
MPIDETPPAQLVVALATKWTGEESPLLFRGEETETPANEHTDSANMQTKVFIFISSKLVPRAADSRQGASCAAQSRAESQSTVERELLTFNQGAK